MKSMNDVIHRERVRVPIRRSPTRDRAWHTALTVAKKIENKKKKIKKPGFFKIPLGGRNATRSPPRS